MTALVADLPDLKRRTDLDLLYADGAYGGPHSDVALVQQQVTLIQTAIVGPKPDPGKLHLADFAITAVRFGIAGGLAAGLTLNMYRWYIRLAGNPPARR